MIIKVCGNIFSFLNLVIIACQYLMSDSTAHSKLIQTIWQNFLASSNFNWQINESNNVFGSTWLSRLGASDMHLINVWMCSSLLEYTSYDWWYSQRVIIHWVICIFQIFFLSVYQHIICSSKSVFGLVILSQQRRCLLFFFFYK